MLKKPGSNQQPNRGNSRKRSNSNVSRNSQNHNNMNESSNRNTGHRRKPHETHLWASSASASTTLTSHLSMVNRRNQDGPGKSNGKPRVSSNHTKNERTRDKGQQHTNKRYHNNKSNSAHIKQSPREAQTTSNTSAQVGKIGHS